jgi:hypothetical protein
MSEKRVVITKLGESASMPEVKPKAPRVTGKSILKTARILPSSDPAKSPPVKKSMKKHTIRLLTKKGSRDQRKTLRRKVAKLSDTKLKQIASNYGILKNPNTPIPILREMVEGGAVAGFLSIE